MNPRLYAIELIREALDTVLDTYQNGEDAGEHTDTERRMVEEEITQQTRALRLALHDIERKEDAQ